MTQAHKTIGNLVEFHDKVFDETSVWYPHFNDYKNHVFEVLDVPFSGHVKIRCISGLMSYRDNSQPLEISIHDDEIKTVPKNKIKIKL